MQHSGDEAIEVVTSLATRRLREVDPDCEPSGKEKNEAFHYIVQKLLWIMKMMRPDLETEISYLRTRVTKRDADDWGKLKRVIAFIKCTIDDVRITGANDLHRIFTWIDAACAANANMRS